MYIHISKLAEHILNSKRKTFPLEEVFQIITGKDKMFIGKKSDRQISHILALIGFNVTVHRSQKGTEIELHTNASPEEILKRAEEAEWKQYVTRAFWEPPPESCSLAFRNLPAILRQIEVMGRKGLPVQREDLERLCRLAGYSLRG